MKLRLLPSAVLLPRLQLDLQEQLCFDALIDRSLFVFLELLFNAGKVGYLVEPPQECRKAKTQFCAAGR